uniref:Uncharacterized protein n=1 Tax=Panagrolaimus sp. ES5 TaxID=591445 RepID=A0AC34FAN9_9BILA
MFLTNDFNLIGFEDESNVWTKAMVNNDIDKYNFTFIKSQLLEKHLYLLVLHNDSYYIIISEILKGDKKINASMVKLGQRDIVFPNLECDNIYFIKVEGVNIGIVIVLSLFCASLLIVIIVVGIIYYRRYEKKKAKRNEIKIVEKEVLLKDHFQERTTAQTPNLSNISQSGKLRIYIRK